MRKLFGENKPSPIAISLKDMFTNIVGISESHKRCSDDLKQFGASISKLVGLWAPPYTDKIREYNEAYNQLSDVYLQLSEAELRVSEDINDLLERKLTVDKFRDLYNKAKNAYQDASSDVINELGAQAFESRQPGYENKKEKIEARVVKAKSYKKKCFEEQRIALETYIRNKEGSVKFRINRICSAFSRYSTAVKEASQKEGTLQMTILAILRDMKDNGASQSVIETIENSAPNVQIDTPNVIDQLESSILDKEPFENDISSNEPSLISSTEAEPQPEPVTIINDPTPNIIDEPLPESQDQPDSTVHQSNPFDIPQESNNPFLMSSTNDNPFESTNTNTSDPNPFDI